MIRTLEGRYKTLRRLDGIERRILGSLDECDAKADALLDGPMYGALSVDLDGLRAERRRLWKRLTFLQACITVTARGAH